jgi:hypothetical protein
VGLFVPRVTIRLIMKKTAKTSKTPAPATKLTAPAPAHKSTVAPKIKKPAVPSPAAPAIVTKPKGSRVTIAARIDVGFGNSLYVRGDEPFLRWSKGLALGCISKDKWEIVLTGIDRPFQFKFLRNDEEWSSGENYTASPGDTLTLTPSF